MVARHSWSHAAHFQSALYADPYANSVGFTSGSAYSRDSLSPRSPFSSHHSRKKCVSLCGSRFEHAGHPLSLFLLVRLHITARHSWSHAAHFQSAL
jgi:hypothetical protein